MSKQLISIILPDLSGGGAERLHVLLANYWQSKDYKVHFVLMKKEGDLLSLVSKDIEIFQLEVKNIRKVILPLAKYLKKKRPNIIISAMWPLTSVSVFSWLLSGKKGKIYLSEHVNWSSYLASEELVSSKYLALTMRFTYKFASGLIAVSEGVKQDLIKILNFEDKKITVINNPVSNGTSKDSLSKKEKEKLWGPQFTFHILSVGSLKRQKDHAALIKAFAIISKSYNAKLTILGEGNLRKNLETLIKSLELNDKVVMPGFEVNPYPWYQSADLFVLSSVYEGFGNVIVEALECGVTVVSTDCMSGPSEILENGRYGYLVPVSDHISLASSIEYALKNPLEKKVLVGRSKDFLVSTIAEKYLSYFELNNL